MADVFLSYATEDRERARALATDLESLGWTIWWDRKLAAGTTFAGVIEAEIEQARCVIVLWSKASVASRWVRDEATEGLERELLVPVLIDAVEPPLGFRSIHAADLVGWSGDHTSPGFRQLVSDLARLLGPPPRSESAFPPPPSPPSRRWPRWLAPGVGIACLIALLGWGLARYLDDQGRRTAELETQRRAIDDARRAADESAAKRQAELESRQRALEDRQRAAEAADARRREAEAEAARRLEADRAREAADAARRAEEAKRRDLVKAAPRPEPRPEPRVDPGSPAPEAKPAAAPAPAPDPARAVRAPLLPAPGDRWTYRYVDGFRRGEIARLTYSVESASDTGVAELLRVSNLPDYASRITVPREPRFAGHAGLEYAPPDLAPYLLAYNALEEGAVLSTVKRVLNADATIAMQIRVAGREQVSVPAGTFDAVKVVAEGRGQSFINRIPMHSIVTIWYAPAAKRFVKYDARTYERTLPQELATFELVDYKLAR